MSKSTRVRAADVRAIFCLANECRDLGDDPAAWRRHLLLGSIRLSGASAGIAIDGHWAPSGDTLHVTDRVIAGLENGFDAPALARLHAAYSQRGFAIVPMFAPFLVALRRDRSACLSRTQLVRDRDWYGSPYFRDYQRPTGADTMLYCVHPQAGSARQIVGLTLVRPHGEADFSPRARAVVQEIHALVARQVGGALAAPGEPSPALLSPRLRQVLACLLEGDSDKQIAALLGLSRHTVNEHVQRVFAHFGVQTRSELLSRWVRRAWRDHFHWAERPQ